MSSPDIPVVSCAAVDTAVAVLTALDVSEFPTVAVAVESLLLLQYWYSISVRLWRPC